MPGGTGGAVVKGAAVVLLALATFVCETGPADPPGDGTGKPVAAATAETEASTMRLTSTAFTHESSIPTRFTCDGEDVSPALSWSDGPGGVQTFALIMDDPDAPPGTWVHWVAWNVEGSASGLPEGVPKEESLDGGASQGACWGVDSFDRVGYHGPCPPPGSPHRYYFKLYALDARLDLPARATKDQVVRAMDGHILAETQLMGLYER